MLKEVIQYLHSHENMDELFESFTGKGINVAVLDSGIDATHPDLEGRIITSVTFTQKRGKVIRNMLPPRDNDKSGHGTGAAGIISQVSRNARMIDVRVLNDLDMGFFQVMFEGLRYAIKEKVQLINMGLGVKQEKFIAPILQLLQEAYKRNIVIVAASDNKGQTIYPAAIPYVISVNLGLTTSLKEFCKNASGFVEFGGYGAGIRTCGLNHSYVEQTGNSFAASHICGIVALILEKWPGLKLHEIKFILSYYAKLNNIEQDDIRRLAYEKKGWVS